MYQEKVDLSGLAESITEELRSTQPGRSADLVIAPEVIVKGDKNLLEIALRNLLENAWKYTGKCPHTQIEFGSLNQNGEKVHFVRDNGVGFDMKYQDKLFQPFQRLHSEKDYAGTGIGLATLQRLIRRHSGRIWANPKRARHYLFFTLGKG
jgi:light-regulated signal transduction histidine kinase (bacteriophytochrome)